MSRRGRNLVLGWMVVVLAWNSYLIVDDPHGPWWSATLGILLPVAGAVVVELGYRRDRRREGTGA